MSAPQSIATGALAQSIAREIAESIVGDVRWEGSEGYCPCPGEAKHTSAGATECKVVAEPLSLESGGTLPPGVYCFHDSCAFEVEAASYRLRRALWERSPSCGPLPPRFARRPRSRTQFDPATLARIARKLGGIDAEWFADRSPIRPDTRTPASFLHSLYQSGEKVVVFSRCRSQGQHVWTCIPTPFDATELSDFCEGKLKGVWFLTNPVDGFFYPDEKGKRSRRSWRSITSWRYLLLESDEADPNKWLAALAQMPLRIAAIYTSGRRSIHALVLIEAESKRHWDAVCKSMEFALVTLGACRGALSAVRLSRLPGCMRLGTEDSDRHYVRFSEPARQTLLYLNPNPTRTPICELPVLREPETDLARWSMRGEAFQ